MLLETKEAVDIIDETLNLPEIDEVHIGLNDLHLSYGMTFMFELLVNGTVEDLCNKMREKNIFYGFGGIAKLGEGLLPAEYVIAEHYRLHSQAAILSRSFYDSVDETDYIAIKSFFEESMMELILKSVNTSEGLPHIVVWWFFFIYFSVDIRKQFLL